MIPIIRHEKSVVCLNYNQSAMLVDCFRDAYHAKEVDGKWTIDYTAENLRAIVARAIETRDVDKVWGVNARQLMNSLDQFTNADAEMLISLIQNCYEILLQRARRLEFYVGGTHLPIERTDLYGAGLLGNMPAESDSGHLWVEYP